MAASYSSTEKKYSKQYAAGFAAYMMVGSLFQKCICRNEREARHLYLHYKEMPQNQQFSVEDSILSQIRDLDAEFVEELQQLKCEVSFRHEKDSYFLFFRTGGFGDIVVHIDQNGRFKLQEA